jgi:hypothetical protein
MVDTGERAIALGAWEQALGAYRDAAAAIVRRGALAGPPDLLELDLLETLQWEQQQALGRYLGACRDG